MNPVFLDTVGMIATWNRGDQWHDTATKAFSALQSGRVPLDDAADTRAFKARREDAVAKHGSARIARA